MNATHTDLDNEHGHKRDQDADHDGGHGGGHGHRIDYVVDDEPESTTEKTLTPVQIMSNAGIDPNANYLEQLVHGHDNVSYKDKPNEEIKMKHGMRFITKPIGPMPVS
ncbi:MAG TPA: hypothetical protein VJR92_06995 [Gemmatimonadaceae bacterium]|nr:hypothetical protein [Gemmatimonadaceae bacterium]